MTILLDKLRNLWYNNIIGYGKGKHKMNNMKELLEGFSPNKDLSQSNIEKITIIGNTLKTVVDENFPSLRYPVIAGGAIRDAVFGQKIKDYDIFFDTSSLENDEKADTALLLIALTCEKLAAGPFPALAECVYSVVGKDADYELKGLSETNPAVPFIVYQNSKPTYPEAFVNWDQMVLAEPEPVGEPREFPLLQMIGHDDKRLTDAPLSFLEYFDYALVKGLFDPTDMGFHFHRTMLESIYKRELKFSGYRTNVRVRSFFDKLRYVSGVDGQKMADSFRIVDETPKAKDPSDYPFTTGLSKETTALSRLGQQYIYQPRGQLYGNPNQVVEAAFWDVRIDNLMRPPRVADEPLDDNF